MRFFYKEVSSTNTRRPTDGGIKAYFKNGKNKKILSGDAKNLKGQYEDAVTIRSEQVDQAKGSVKKEGFFTKLKNLYNAVNNWLGKNKIKQMISTAPPQVHFDDEGKDKKVDTEQ